MNKETGQILDYINKSGHYLERVQSLRMKHNNIKDFQVMLGYVIMEIVSEEKKFINLKRGNIELPEISVTLFERGIV